MDIQPGDKVRIKPIVKPRDAIQTALNVLIIVFVCVGISKMLDNPEQGAGLTGVGIENLKYFTVLSNIFAGGVAIIWVTVSSGLATFLMIWFVGHAILEKQLTYYIFCDVYNIKSPVLLKLMSASAVGLTFLIIAAFLAPMYPDLDLYTGSNLYFHRVVPLLAMAEMILMKVDRKIPFKYTLISASLALIYDVGYVINILINGIGEWPNTNDWYGFLNWGYPIGAVIFVAIVLMDFGIACLLRGLNILVNKICSHFYIAD